MLGIGGVLPAKWYEETSSSAHRLVSLWCSDQTEGFGPTVKTSAALILGSLDLLLAHVLHFHRTWLTSIYGCAVLSCKTQNWLINPNIGTPPNWSRRSYKRQPSCSATNVNIIPWMLISGVPWTHQCSATPCVSLPNLSPPAHPSAASGERPSKELWPWNVVTCWMEEMDMRTCWIGKMLEHLQYTYLINWRYKLNITIWLYTERARSFPSPIFPKICHNFGTFTNLYFRSFLRGGRKFTTFLVIFVFALRKKVIIFGKKSPSQSVYRSANAARSITNGQGFDSS